VFYLFFKRLIRFHNNWPAHSRVMTQPEVYLKKKNHQHLERMLVVEAEELKASSFLVYTLVVSCPLCQENSLWNLMLCFICLSNV
jgi:hypothetical protein